MAVCCAIASGQTHERDRAATSTEPAEVEVPIIHSISSRQPGFGYCGSFAKEVGPDVTEEEFGQLTSPGSERAASFKKERCSFLSRLKVDFNRESLLTYGVNGDCFVRATARVFRNDANREYVLRITKIYGGCRAAGSFEEWLVVEKLQSDYELKVEIRQRDEDR